MTPRGSRETSPLHRRVAGVPVAAGTIAAGTLLYWVAYYMLSTYVPIRMSELGIPDAHVAVAVTGRGLVPLLVALSAGRIADVHGGRVLLVPASVGMVVLGPLHAMAATLPAFLVLQTLLGLCALGVWLPLQAAITHVGDGEALRRSLAVFTFAWGIGMAAGPAIGAWIYDSHGYTILCWCFTAVAAGLLMTSWPVSWPASTASRHDAPNIFRAASGLAGRPQVRAVLVASFMAHYVNSVRNSFYPLILERRGYSVGQIGVLLGVMGVTMIVVRGFLPAIARRTSVRRVLTVSTVVGAAAMTVTPWTTGMVALAVGALLIGACLGFNPPITVEMLALHTSAQERALSAGLRLVANRLAQSVQPVVFGVTAAVSATALAFPVSGVLLSGLAVSLVRALRPEKERAAGAGGS